MWEPRFTEKNEPMYLLIAGALRRDIENGVLTPGERLPTLKELAGVLSVTPGTVNRAYEEAARQGLVQGEVGRGTFVRRAEAVSGASNAGLGATLHSVSAYARPQQSRTGVSNLAPPLVSLAARSGMVRAPAPVQVDQIDLSIIKPHADTQENVIRTALENLADSPDFAQSLDYTPDGGHPAHRDAGATWLRRFLPDVHWQQVVLTAGAQHGLLVAMNALTAHGELILCEELCYPGIISLAHSSGRRLRGVEMDEEGIRPDSLRDLCRRERPAMLVTVATCQNPTTAIMSNARRAEIAKIAREFDFFILDDDIYGFLATEPVHTMTSFAPERTIYLTSLSKNMSPSLRIGYLYGPPNTLSRLMSMVRTSIWMTSPLVAQLASNIINTGVGANLVQIQRQEAAARQAMAAEVFRDFNVRSQPYGYHIWITLPQPWSSDEFANLARAHGVTISSGTQFLAERSATTRGVRIVLMSPTSRDELKLSLTKLASMIASSEPRLYY